MAWLPDLISFIALSKDGADNGSAIGTHPGRAESAMSAAPGRRLSGASLHLVKAISDEQYSGVIGPRSEHSILDAAPGATFGAFLLKCRN